MNAYERVYAIAMVMIETEYQKIQEKINGLQNGQGQEGGYIRQPSTSESSDNSGLTQAQQGSTAVVNGTGN